MHTKIIDFKTTLKNEALLLIKKVLISCDSIKNWQDKDQFFSDETFELMKSQGSIGQAKIDDTWFKAMNPAKEELKSILDLDFSILITAHGPPLFDNPKEKISISIKKII